MLVWLFSSALPVYVDPALGGGYGSGIHSGSALITAKLKVFSAPGTELAAGSYAANAALLADAVIQQFGHGLRQTTVMFTATTPRPPIEGQ